ncbi:MAG: alpha/beta hydrolase [Clostridia bacterium]|nr:alpha/beta hydrolase [Clostridia bacterium]
MAKITIANNPGMHGMVDLKTGVVFSRVGGQELALQLLKPMWSSGGQGFPLVLFIQGSAWTKPNQFWQLPQLTHLALRGFVIASVTHRSCFEACAPAFLQDVKSALRFLRLHAAEYDIDPGRVCAWGTSSGGNTALLLGMTGDDPAFETDENKGPSTAVQAVVDCFGPTDLNRMIDVQYAAQPRDEENILYALGGRNPDTCAETLKRISPCAYVRSGLNLPPFLILHGDADDVVLCEDSEALHDSLTAHGYEADFVRVTGAPHEDSFWSSELLEIIFRFIEDRIGSK